MIDVDVLADETCAELAHAAGADISALALARGSRRSAGDHVNRSEIDCHAAASRWEAGWNPGSWQAEARVRKRPSAEDNFRVVVRYERLFDGVRLHAEAAARAVQKTAHREQPIL
jgi:hypothetical protein